MWRKAPLELWLWWELPQYILPQQHSLPELLPVPWCRDSEELCALCGAPSDPLHHFISGHSHCSRKRLQSGAWSTLCSTRSWITPSFGSCYFCPRESVQMMWFWFGNSALCYLGAAVILWQSTGTKINSWCLNSAVNPLCVILEICAALWCYIQKSQTNEDLAWKRNAQVERKGNHPGFPKLDLKCWETVSVTFFWCRSNIVTKYNIKDGIYYMDSSNIYLSHDIKVMGKLLKQDWLKSCTVARRIPSMTKGGQGSKFRVANTSSCLLAVCG